MPHLLICRERYLSLETGVVGVRWIPPHVTAKSAVYTMRRDQWRIGVAPSRGWALPTDERLP
ncbi:hypothetical protein [Neorhodopirellula pilleata]|uniref:hypothetical protein n=1 Tax=Neorhodopirellula pilleata TaxID=2714738 RepID=UPI0011B5A188|nr:hypothetical protein [Neorhodopirellula pilleata]